MAKEERYTLPFIVFFLYSAAVFVGICVYRLGFPLPVPEPVEILDRFKLGWRFSGGILTFIHLFPALAFSGLVIPFGLREHSEGGYAGSTFVGKKSFSASFLKYFTWPVITASSAAVIYGLLFFLVLPITVNSRMTALGMSDLYAQAQDRARTQYAARNYAETLRLIALCEQISPGNENLEKLKANVSEVLAQQEDRRAGNSRVEERASPAGYLPGDPASSIDALTAAVKAFNEERYYDAHWLATLAQRLARPGAAEISSAQALASRAWEKITALEPSAQEKERYSLYRLKRDAYEAMTTGDWISAFYSFQELSVLTPADPDVVQYLEASKNGLASIAFFSDESDSAVSTILAGPVFSLPFEGGRLVLRCMALSLLPDHAYARGLEAAASDASGSIRFRFASDYAKLIPLSGGGEGKTAVLLRSLDRDNQEIRHDPVWTRGIDEESAAGIPEGYALSGEQSFGASQVLLEINYDDFLLLSKMRRGMDALNLRELFTAEQRFESYGYAAPAFRAEVLRRLGDTLFFLPMAVLVLILGWRYRAQKKPRYVYVPMLGILPLVFYGVVLFYRHILDNFSIWLSLGMGFTPALIVLCAGSALCFLLTLVFLAAQHG